MSKELACYGCGLTLHSGDEKLPGYVPAKAFETRNKVLCQRCFRLQHYNTNSDFENLFDQDYREILENLISLDALIVYVIDIFNYEASIIMDLYKYVKGKDLLILINKKDILPSSIKDEKIIEWVKERLEKENLKDNIAEIILTSGLTNYNTDLILDKINHYRKGRDVYIIGNTNVGKSTFLNSLLRNYSNETKHFITTSNFPGTTLSAIKIPLDNKSFIYDTPGIIINDLMWSFVEPKVLKFILPSNEIKPLTFQLKSKQSLLLGGLAIFDFLEGENTNFTSFFSNFVEIKRARLDKSITSFNNLVKYNSIRPISKLIEKHDDLIIHTISIEQLDKIDIVINGYGWISFIANKQKIQLKLPKEVNYSIRKALI